MKRTNWLDQLAPSVQAAQVLTPQLRGLLAELDERLFDIWGLGDNIILAWTRSAGELRFLAVRHYAIIEVFGGAPDGGSAAGGDFINGILAGPKHVPPEEFARLCAILGAASRETLLASPLASPLADGSCDALITRLITRYGVTLVRERAVILLDAVGFSLRSPLEQVAMLNSLSYSVNSAYRQLVSKEIEINFARTTTGDGFYIWNRARTIEANIALYKLLMLILTDNAVAQRKARHFPVPRLRAAFHVGEHYEFYQVEALNPTTFGYIVGQVTIELSRMIAAARPGQILMGDFSIDLRGVAGEDRRCATVDFVERTAATLDRMTGLAVGEDRIDTIRCYLTGAPASGGGFGVHRYAIRDKHGLSRIVYNAKINVHPHHDEPLFLGLRHDDLHSDAAPDGPWPGEGV